MKFSKDYKGEGSKQSNGGGGSSETAALFPRLHVNETKNGGPRAPPRNKMALYEQLTIPSHRFLHPAAKPDADSPKTTTLAYPAQHPYNAGLVAPMYMAPPMPFPAMSAGNHPLGQLSMATHTSGNGVDCKAGFETVPNLSHHPGSSMISSEEASRLATSVNVRDSNVSSSARRADEDYKVPTLSSDKLSESALTDCRLRKEYLSWDQPPGQFVSGGTSAAISTLNLGISGDSETLQLPAHLGVVKGLFLKSSKASNKSGQDDKNEAGDNEVALKDCGLFGKATKWQSSKIEICSSQQPQGHDSNTSGSSHGYKSGYIRLETLTNYNVDGNEGPAPGDVPLVPRQNYLEASSKTSRNSQGSGEVFNAERQLKVNSFVGNTGEVSSLVNVREAENFHPYSSNGSEDTGDVEYQTDGSGVGLSEPTQPEGEETSNNSDSSMVDSLPASKVQPKDIIGAVGQHEFWKMRKAILKQRRIFAMQLFELHRLVKVHEMMADSPTLRMADSPTLRIEGFSDCPSALTLPVKDSKSLGEFSVAKDDQKEAKRADCQNDDSLRMPAVLQVSSLPETADLSSHFSENAQGMNYEPQSQVYAAPLSFPIVPGQDNAWGYAPQPNASINQWVGGSMAAWSVAYPYHPYSPFPPFYAPLGAYGRPYSPIFGVPSRFEVHPPIYPPVGYQQQLDMHLDAYQLNKPSHNEQWHSSIRASSPAGPSALDGIIPALHPYIPPFVDTGRRDGSDAKDYGNHSAMSRTPPTVIGRAGQLGSSRLAYELSSEMLDTTAMEASRWNGNQFCSQQVEPYAPWLDCQQPLYYSPRDFFPVLPPNPGDKRVQVSHFRGPLAAGCSNDEIDSSEEHKAVDNMEYEQDKLFKRPREGSHTGRIIQHGGKPEEGTDVIMRSIASDITQGCLPVSPRGSAFSAFNYRRPCMSDGHHTQVIKAVPRAMVATPESAAEILHSIQHKRQ